MDNWWLLAYREPPLPPLSSSNTRKEEDINSENIRWKLSLYIRGDRVEKPDGAIDERWRRNARLKA